MGFVVRSSWLKEEALSTPDDTHWQARARQDLKDVSESDILIVDTVSPSPRGGREVEVGAALASAKLVYVVGPHRNVFHTLAQATFRTWAEALAFLRGCREEQP